MADISVKIVDNKGVALDVPPPTVAISTEGLQRFRTLHEPRLHAILAGNRQCFGTPHRDGLIVVVVPIAGGSSETRVVAET